MNHEALVTLGVRAVLCDLQDYLHAHSPAGEDLDAAGLYTFINDILISTGHGES